VGRVEPSTAGNPAILGCGPGTGGIATPPRDGCALISISARLACKSVTGVVSVVCAALPFPESSQTCYEAGRSMFNGTAATRPVSSPYGDSATARTTQASGRCSMLATILSVPRRRRLDGFHRRRLRSPAPAHRHHAATGRSTAPRTKKARELPPGPLSSSGTASRHYMPMSPMPPMSGMPPPCLWSSSFGASATITSVVSSRPATEAAFCSARRVTFVGSRMPMSSMSP